MKYILYRIVRTLGYPIFLLLYRPEFEGRNNIPKSGSVILAGNHTNNLDAAIMLAGPTRVVHMLAKKELFKSKRDFCQQEIQKKEAVIKNLDTHILRMYSS